MSTIAVRYYKTFQFEYTVEMDAWLNAHREWTPVAVFSAPDSDSGLWFILALCCQLVPEHEDE